MSTNEFRTLGDFMRARRKAGIFQGWRPDESYRDYYERLRKEDPARAKEFVKQALQDMIGDWKANEEVSQRAVHKAAQMEADKIAPVTMRERYHLAKVRGDWNEEMSQRWSGLPAETRERFRLESFKSRRNHPSVSQALEAVRHWLEGKITLLTLFGLPGVGKTHLLIGAGWELVERLCLVIYRDERALVNALQQAVGSHHFQEVMVDLKTVPWLIIDDLGVSATTDWSRSALDEIVDARWLNRLPLLVATNLKGQDLPPRLASRLGDVALGLVVQVDASDYRRGLAV